MSDEWYTPSYIIEPIRQLLGGIELDPCSTAEANKTVKAERFFTKEHEATGHDWRARTIFMNPPYSMPLCEDMVLRFLGNLNYGNFEKGALLVHSKTELLWYQQAVIECAFMVFPRRRIKFICGGEDIPATIPLFEQMQPPSEASQRPTSGSTIFFFGDISAKDVHQAYHPDAIARGGAYD